MQAYINLLKEERIFLIL